MCLILLAYRAHADYPLVVAANRDEYYERPTQPAAFWQSQPQLLAGRDLRAGGTWLGITRGGRFAAITNYRAGPRAPSSGRSRGELTLNFLRGSDPPAPYAEKIMAGAKAYNGFNLLVGDLSAAEPQLVYCNNLNLSVQALAPGVYGLSNHVLDTGWPKVERGKQALCTVLAQTQSAISPQPLLDILADNTRAPDAALPDTGIELGQERALSPIFISTETYGTCCSTAVIVNRENEVVFHERSFYATKRSPADAPNDEIFRFRLNDQADY